MFYSPLSVFYLGVGFLVVGHHSLKGSGLSCLIVLNYMNCNMYKFLPADILTNKCFASLGLSFSLALILARLSLQNGQQSGMIVFVIKLFYGRFCFAK